jgi:hypothetical protein
MVMPELSILFTKKISKTDLMEGWFYNRSWFTLGTKRKFTNHQTTIYFTPKSTQGVSLNYRKKQSQCSFKAIIYIRNASKNEFVTRYYDNGDVITIKTKKTNYHNIEKWF